jgi:hypothetical protein
VCQKEVKWLVVLSVCVLMCSVSERSEVVGGVVGVRADASIRPSICQFKLSSDANPK